MNSFRLICSLIALVLTVSSASAGSAPQAAPDEALVNLLRQADGLIKNGKAVDAYKLLGHEGDYSGEIGYDYLLGIAALDSGKPDRAIIAV